MRLKGANHMVFLTAVLASMLALFLAPPAIFVPTTFLATAVMTVAAYVEGGFRGFWKAKGKSLLLGVVTAATLYGVFFFGAASIREFHPFGLTSNSESAIYSLIASPSNPFLVQVGVLLFDAVGYESYFRGTVQRLVQPRMAIAAVPAVALLDASMHLATFYQYPGAPVLWFATTFIADLVWGLTYYFSRSLAASFTSHFLWDIAIFIIAPIT